MHYIGALLLKWDQNKTMAYTVRLWWAHIHLRKLHSCAPWNQQTLSAQWLEWVCHCGQHVNFCQHLKRLTASHGVFSGAGLTSELASSLLCNRRPIRPVLLTLTFTCRQGNLDTLQQSDPQLYEQFMTPGDRGVDDSTRPFLCPHTVSRQNKGGYLRLCYL